MKKDKKSGKQNLFPSLNLHLYSYIIESSDNEAFSAYKVYHKTIYRFMGHIWGRRVVPYPVCPFAPALAAGRIDINVCVRKEERRSHMKARKSTAKPYQGTATHNKHVLSNNLANHGKLWDAKPGASGLTGFPREPSREAAGRVGKRRSKGMKCSFRRKAETERNGLCSDEAPRSTGCTANCGKPQDAKPEAVGLPHGQLYARSVTGLFASE